MRKKAAAKSCPTLEAISVARSAPRRVASSARKILPPSSGKGGDEVEERKNDIEVAQIEQELAHRPYAREQLGWHARYGSKQKAHTEEDRSEHHVHQWAGDGYLDLICRLLGKRLQIGDPAYGHKRYAVDLEA
jgi:hypothetical protein